MTTPLKAGILTASDRSHRGEREDISGVMLKNFIEQLPAEILAAPVLPDEKEEIKKALIHLADVLHCDLIVTTGGTGLAPRDVTPEATREVIEKEIPGISESLRAAGMLKKKMAMLSRGIAGVRGRTLIINLPGNPKAVEDAFEVLGPVLKHAVELLKGEVRDCQTSLSSQHSHS